MTVFILLLDIADRIGSQAEELAKLCGCLPIALRNATYVLADRKDLGVAEYLERLQEARNRVDLVEASFGLSYDLLSPELRRLWCLLSVFPPGAGFDREGAAAVIPASGLGEEMYLAKPMFAADFVINLPKLKTHSATIYTGAVKNLFGCIPGLRKAEYHRLAPDPRDFGQVLADIHQAVKVGLHIMDGVTAMEGEGPTAGSVYPAGKLLFSTDPLALDTVAAAMLGLGIEDIPILKTARARNLGESNLAEIEIAGDYTSPPGLRGFKLPKRLRYVKPRNYKVVIRVIDLLKARPRVNLKSCKHCNMCVESCPVQAIDRKTKKINYNICIECMCCHELCEHKAVELRKDNPLLDVLSRAFSRQPSHCHTP